MYVGRGVLAGHPARGVGNSATAMPGSLVGVDGPLDHRVLFGVPGRIGRQRRVGRPGSGRGRRLVAALLHRQHQVHAAGLPDVVVGPVRSAQRSVRVVDTTLHVQAPVLVELGDDVNRAGPPAITCGWRKDPFSSGATAASEFRPRRRWS